MKSNFILNQTLHPILTSGADMSQSTAQMSMSQAAHKPNCIQQANKLARLLFYLFLYLHKYVFISKA